MINKLLSKILTIDKIKNSYLLINIFILLMNKK